MKDSRTGAVSGMNGSRRICGHLRVTGRASGEGTAAPSELDISPPGWHQDPTKQGPSRMKQFFLKFFTWWNGQTFGTQLWTRRYGELVGQDEQGNLYYRTRGGVVDPTLGFERRWVVYNGYAEASRIPPSWHGWMHHTV